MPSQYDKMPDDFNIDQLSEPHPETIASFQAVCSRLDDISITSGSWRDDNPDEPSGQSVSYILMKNFENGSRVLGSSTHGTDEWLEAHSETMPIRSITLRVEDGTKYEFTDKGHGALRLWINRPGERVIRETPAADRIGFDSDSELSLEIMAIPEDARDMSAKLAEREEVINLGLDMPNDGGMKEFTNALQEALDSGISPEQIVPDNPPEQ